MIHVLEGLKFCPHCRHDSKILVSEDTSFRIYWVGDAVVFDVGFPLMGAGYIVLYREVYACGVAASYE